MTAWMWGILVIVVLILSWFGCGALAVRAVLRTFPDDWQASTSAGMAALLLLVVFAAGPVSLRIVMKMGRRK
jgi:hypothetical protein